MYKSMPYIDFFLYNTARRPTVQPRAVCIEEDWKFICSVFPEIGFRSYFLGFIVSKLAEELKQNGIISYHERAERPEFADISRFLSHISLIGKEIVPDGRSGVGPACGEAKKCKGDSASDASTAGGKTEEGKGGEGKSKAEPVFVGLTRCSYCSDLLSRSKSAMDCCDWENHSINDS